MSNRDLDDDFIILAWFVLNQNEPVYQQARTTKLAWDNMSDAQCKQFCRFHKHEVIELAHLLGVDTLQFPDRLNPNRYHAFCVFLPKFKSANKYRDMCDFGYDVSVMSRIFKTITLYLYQKYKDMLIWDDRRLTREELTEYAGMVSRNTGGVVKTIWGFIERRRSDQFVNLGQEITSMVIRAI